MTCTEGTEGSVTEVQKRQASSIGQIVLYFYNTASLEEVTRANLPRLDTHQNSALSQKAVKATVSPGDSLTYQTTYLMSTLHPCGDMAYHHRLLCPRSPRYRPVQPRPNN
jgi:hypothetical protein